MTLGLYVHIPFCLRKCYYCDFLSKSPHSPEEIENYLQALEGEMELAGHYLTSFKGDIKRQLTSIYIGGGTPTVLTGDQLIRILKKCRTFFYCSPQAEITVEANPGTVDFYKLQKLKEEGVNRLSFGVQSFHDPLLKAMGRAHTKGQALKGIEGARKAGFTNISLDLIFGLPGQTLKIWEDTLEEALALEVPHISLYGLQLERGTPWGEKYAQDEGDLPTEEVVLAMRALADEKLQARGYSRYEISNYCLPGYESRHNLGYWHNEDYWGLGLGAASHWGRRRWVNLSDFHAYERAIIKGQLPLASQEILTFKEAAGETVFLALRLKKGLNLEVFRRRFGVSLEDVFPQELEELLSLGLLEKRAGHLCLTPRGRDVANRVFMYFV